MMCIWNDEYFLSVWFCRVVQSVYRLCMRYVLQNVFSMMMLAISFSSSYSSMLSNTVSLPS